MKKFLLLFLANFYLVYAYPEIPPGYYNAATGQTGLVLQQTLHNIIKNHTVLSYTPGVWNSIYTTDDKPNGTLWDMYSDIPNGTPNGDPPYVYQIGADQCLGGSPNEGYCYAREHSWPSSWFGNIAPMNTDIFHIVPVDQYVNQMHSNYPYGKVGTATWTSLNGSKVGPCISPGYSGTVFEPIDEYKGDFARGYFYFETRYYSEDNGWPGSPMAVGSQLLPWAQDLMLLWAQNDPVSQKEIDRNDDIYTNYQHNRNPFIDHPEYATAIWGNSSGVLGEPSNYPSGFSSHNIYLQWTDPTGTNLPEGYLVRMSSVGFSSIADPIDGIQIPNSATEKNVFYSLQGTWFTDLVPNTTYYFKLFAFSGSGNSINYKTDAVPQFQQTTQP
jgi:endonuclease I